MNASTLSEFAQYRFVRDTGGNVIALPSSGVEEKILLVLDCERWGLARLHIFEGAALRADALEAFQEDLGRIAAVRSDSLARLISWGRDAGELFYADTMRDGEPLAAYLERTGGVPVPIAAKWICRLLDLLASIDAPPPSLERFSTVNFEVVLDRFGAVYPVFSEFCEWTRPGPLVREHRLEYYLAQVFCSLMAGVPIRTFHRDSLPRNFDVLEERYRAVLVETLEEDGENTYELFREAMESISEWAEDRENEAAIPLMPVREWLRRDLANSHEGIPDYVLEAEPDRNGPYYAIPSHLRGAAVNIQLIPGPDSLPREGWLGQHHDATRRPGRGRLSQLCVNYLEDRQSITLVGEERVEGVDLESFIRGTGPLPLCTVALISAAIHSALDGLEKQTGSSAVWWLPPENIFLVTGTRSVHGSAGLMERKGSDIWSRLPFKFRLHQTMESLKPGVNVPSKLRELFRLPGKQFLEVRRSAIAVPLLWYLLTATKFRWSRKVESHPCLPGPLAELFERFRRRLSENPSEVGENFFLLFPHELAREVAEDEREDENGDKNAPAEAENDPEVPLHVTLHEGEIGELKAPLEDFTPEESARLESAMEKLSRKGGSPPWLWISLTGVVTAALFGYLLSGWHFQRGPFQGTPAREFSVPDFRVAKSEGSADARVELENFLVSSGTPESLGLLPMLEKFDAESNQKEIMRHLGEATDRGEVAAYRVLGMLARADGESSGTVAAYFLEGAKRGDTESQYQFALLRWQEGGRISVDSETLRFLEMAAEVGHAEARELLGLVKLADGDGAGAVKWMELSARQGNPSAEYRLGLYYSTGVGGVVDKAKAASYFRAAAEKGDERAMYYFGRCLSEGFGVHASFPEAQRWMRAASALGHGGALRWCLDRGIDVSDETDP